MELLFYFYFDRKSVGVPSGLSVYLIALHGLVAGYGVFEGPGHYMVYARLAVGCRRAFVEYERCAAFSGVYAFFEKVFFFPFFDLLVLHLCYGLV